MVVKNQKRLIANFNFKKIMSRRSRAQRKLAEPDPIYNSRLVTLLVSRILQSGKKSLAQKIVYKL